MEDIKLTIEYKDDKGQLQTYTFPIEELKVNFDNYNNIPWGNRLGISSLYGNINDPPVVNLDIPLSYDQGVKLKDLIYKDDIMYEESK